MTSLADTNLVYTEGEHPLHGTWLSVDVVAITEDKPVAKVVLISREGSPHRGETTLPGGLVAAWYGETIEDTARRVLREKAGIVTDNPVISVDVISDSGRDERGHTVSIVVAIRVPAGVPGAVSFDEIPESMPFGHSAMLRSVLTKIGQRLFFDADTTFALLGDETTAPDAMSIMWLCDREFPENTIRARLKRSSFYQMTRDTRLRGDGVGRPSKVYQRINEPTT